MNYNGYDVLGNLGVFAILGCYLFLSWAVMFQGAVLLQVDNIEQVLDGLHYFG